MDEIIPPMLDDSFADKTKNRPPADQCRVCLDHVTVKWPSTGTENDLELKNTLSDISFDVRASQLLAVVGQVGSGKVNKTLKQLLLTLKFWGFLCCM